MWVRAASLPALTRDIHTYSSIVLDLRGLPPLSDDPGPAAAWKEWLGFQFCERLARFDPVLVSSFAAGLHTDVSDLDIVCDTRAGGFLEAVGAAYGERPGFEHWTAGTRTMVAFQGQCLLVELAGEDLPVERQRAYRHAVAQRRLAALGGPAFVTAMGAVRRLDGLKTELAIARFLRLGGDPYEAVERLSEVPDRRLRELLARAVERL